MNDPKLPTPEATEVEGPFAFAEGDDPQLDAELGLGGEADEQAAHLKHGAVGP
jgi:hypothetical protein